MKKIFSLKIIPKHALPTVQDNFLEGFFKALATYTLASHYDTGFTSQLVTMMYEASHSKKYVLS